MADEPIPSAEVSRSELKQATFSSLRWVTIARIAAELLSLAAGILLAHLVPPADFGRVAIAIVVSELGLALANQGAGSVLVQRKTLDRAHVESAAMLAFLQTRLDDPNVQCRWRWRQYDVAMWDERCTNHRAMSDHYPHYRMIRRCLAGAGAPIAVGDAR